MFKSTYRRGGVDRKRAVAAVDSGEQEKQVVVGSDGITAKNAT